MAILWFIFSQIVSAVQVASKAIATTVGSTSVTYNQIDAFLTNIFTWFLPIMLLGLAYWVYIYSQRKGEVM
jgi:hypothetical protein